MTEEGNDDNTESADGKTWTNPFSAEFDKRKATFEAMPGFQIKVGLEALGRAGHVMYKNAEELGRLRSSCKAASWLAMYQTSTRNELVRFLHNYLASICSLIEGPTRSDASLLR